MPTTPWVAGPISLAQALEAAKVNAASRISQQDLAAANSDVLSASRFPLPVFSAKAAATDAANGSNAGIGSGTSAGNASRKTDKSWGLDWTLERGGKRGHRTEAELAETQIQQQLLVKDLFYDLLAAQERSKHLKAIAVATETTASAAKLRHKAGDLSAQDMVRVEIESERAMADYRK